MTSSRTRRPVQTLGDLTEAEVLQEILPHLPGGDDDVLVGAGDDTALVRARRGAVLATTDAMVRGRDWLDEWSSGRDVGHKLVAQNAADVAAMGGRTTALLVTLIAEPATPLAWVQDLTAGLAEAAGAAGIAVVGGDLSSAPHGMLAVSVTALGELDGDPVLRSGAAAGEIVAVAGTLGWAGAGWLLLQRDSPGLGPKQVDYHRSPRPPYAQGPAAALAGASAMLDISDGLVRDAGRLAAASDVQIVLDSALLAEDIALLTDVVGAAEARECVLTGGEEHSLLACFPGPGLPEGWRRIGVVRDGAGVTVDGAPVTDGGWDHFAS